MPRSTKASSRAMRGASLLAVLLLAGCAGSSASVKEAPKLTFTSPALKSNALPARYTCDGRNVAPPLEWGAVPPGTENLALFVVAYTPQPSTKTYSVSVEYAVAGINPTLHRLRAGQLPTGAYLGADSTGKPGYSLCPERGKRVQYQFELWGVPSSVILPVNFGALQTLSALSSGRPAQPTAHGVFVAMYKRR